MRLLHERHDYQCQSAIGQKSESQRQRYQAGTRPHSLPMRRASARHARYKACGRQFARQSLERRTTMNKQISRRQLLKGGGALVVSFSFYGPLMRAFAQDAPEARPFAAERIDLGTFVPEPGDYLDAREL